MSEQEHQLKLMNDQPDDDEESTDHEKYNIQNSLVMGASVVQNQQKEFINPTKQFDRKRRSNVSQSDNDDTY